VTFPPSVFIYASFAIMLICVLSLETVEPVSRTAAKASTERWRIPEGLQTRRTWFIVLVLWKSQMQYLH